MLEACVNQEGRWSFVHVLKGVGNLIGAVKCKESRKIWSKNYVKTYEGAFDANYTKVWAKDYSTDYLKNYVKAYQQSWTKTYTTTYTKAWDKEYTKIWVGPTYYGGYASGSDETNYTKSYTKVWDKVYTKIWNKDYHAT